MEGEPGSHVLSLCSSSGLFHKNINDMLPDRGIDGGSGGLIKVGMFEGGLTGGVEASGGAVGPKGMSGDTKLLGGGGGGG